MAKYGSNSFAVSIDNSSGSPVVMTNYIRTIGDVDVKAMMAESTAFGDAWVEKLATGVREAGSLTLGGYYDDTASTGPDVIFNDVASGPTDSTRTLLLTWGGSKTTSAEVWISSYKRTATVGELTGFEVTLEYTGTVTEA
jgi:hypothetical protein